MRRLRLTAPMPSFTRGPHILVLFSCTTLLAACDLTFSPFDLDPRFQRLGRQIDDAAVLVAAERTADALDPSAPLIGGGTLGSRRAAISTRLVASGSRRPDLSTVSADPLGTDNIVEIASTTTSIFMVEGALRVFPGRRISGGQYRMLGLDAIGRAAASTTSIAYDDPNRLVTSLGGRLGLLVDSTGRNGLSLSVLGASVPGANYDVTIMPSAPATGAALGVRVSAVRANIVRLQGSVTRGEWGLMGGLGSTAGSFRVRRLARLTYPDSVSEAEDVRDDSWDQATANAGVTRRVGRIDMAVQYGFTGSFSRESVKPTYVKTSPRHSVSLGAQVIF